MAIKGEHALIFGASGISGWSLMKQCLSYPSPSTFQRVTGLCNRRLERETLLIPNDSRLSIVSGIDLTGSVEIVIEQLKAKVEDVESVDIVFFCAYIQTSDHTSLRKVNTDLLRTAIQAIRAVAPNLEVVILQTGGKGYGLEFPDKVQIQPPLHEDLPRIPEPWRSKIFYYDQYDLLMELSKGSKWTFSEIRPDGIVGFAPSSNAMNMAHGIAFYLTLYREVHGAGASVPFPGKPHGYYSTHSDTFQDILSQMEIYVALHQEKCGNGSSFNAADGNTVSWAQVWPGLCAYFGLVGSEPLNGRQTSMQDFVSRHMDQWKRLAEAHGLKSDTVENQNWGHTHFMLVDFDFNREYSLEKARSVGFMESIDTVEGYKVVFDRMVDAKLIPAFR
ncbi:uncharacterized protein C757.02c [Aspergillus udagawae]|uniref:Uncharacterized protein C757.02c n=1 Tax=Aspergillus udagawae TaxID=91492 RepID=A0ABQ1AMT2_9EURO|nr:uncharacterized protein C757.02c [Aspergillus udagawae]GFF84807.1 uncharacterized protein C757.02c [Aspergillus udagawae]GFG03275.1 uncharacterized protein C757.02c [Aspergillus udagawae]GFG27109.1 uncharacterized protein C757.02c [Aspergillus udagawae]